MLRPGLPVVQIPQAEMVGLAAHDGVSDGDLGGGFQPLDLVPKMEEGAKSGSARREY